MDSQKRSNSARSLWRLAAPLPSRMRGFRELGGQTLGAELDVRTMPETLVD